MSARSIPGEYEVFAETEPNPTERQVMDVTAQYKDSGCDGIVALGGGSSMDLAKAVGLMASHDGPLEQYGATVGGGKLIDRRSTRVPGSLVPACTYLSE